MLPVVAGAAPCTAGDDAAAEKLIDHVVIHVTGDLEALGDSLSFYLPSGSVRSATRAEPKAPKWTADLTIPRRFRDDLVKLSQKGFRITRLAEPETGTIPSVEPGSEKCAALYSFKFEQIWALQVSSQPSELSIIYRLKDSTVSQKQTEFTTNLSDWDDEIEAIVWFSDTLNYNETFRAEDLEKTDDHDEKKKGEIQDILKKTRSRSGFGLLEMTRAQEEIDLPIDWVRFDLVRPEVGTQ